MDETEQRFKRLVEGTFDWVWEVDEHLLITYSSEAVQTLLGYTADEMTGQSLLGSVAPEDRSSVQAAATEILRKRTSFRDLAACWLHSSGGRVCLLSSGVPIIDGQGQFRGFLGVTRDVTERKRAEEELRFVTERLALATGVTELGVWDWDLRSNRTIWDDRMFEIYGLPRLVPMPYERWSGAVHPADLPEAEASLQRAITSKGQDSVDFRIIRPDGSIRVIRAAEGIVVGADGEVIRVVGVNIDITERKRAEVRITQFNRLLRTISEINQLVVRERDRDRLLKEACRILVEQGEFRTAWIGFTDETSGTVISAARAGFEDEDSGSFTIRCDDTPLGRGPIGTAIREGRAVVVNDWETDERVTPWREAARQRGYRSSAACPITVAGRVAGTLSVSAAETDAFDTEVMALLAELAGDIAFALEAIDAAARRDAAERALRESEARFQLLANVAPVGIFRTDKNGSTTYVNRRWTEISGLTADRALGDGWLLAVHPEDRDDLSTGWRDAAVAQHESRADYRFVRHDGTVAWVVGQAIAVLDAAGQFAGYVGTITDITERKRAEETLRASEERYRSVVTAMSEGIVMQDAVGKVVACNLSAERILGLTADQMVGRTSVDPRWRSVRADGSPFPGEDDPAMVTLRNGKPLRDVVMGVHKPNGELTWISINSEPIADQDDPAPRAVVTSFTDITERKCAEEALQESEDLFRYVFDNSVIGMSITRPSGQIQVNQALAEMLGYSLSELQLANWRDLTHPDDIEMTQRHVEELLTGDRQSTRFEKRFLHKNGAIVWADLSSAVRRDREGHPLYLVTAISNITVRKRAEEALRESEQQFRTLAETTGLGILIVQNERYIYANPAAERVTGYTASELSEMRFWELAHPDFREPVRQHEATRLGGARNLPTRYEIKAIFKGGAERWLSLTSGTTMLGSKPALVVSITDITDERRLREQQTALYKISEAAQTAGTLDGLYRSIHAIISRLIDAKNLFIALYDPNTTLLSFPYFIDEVDPVPEPFPLGRGMTSYVVRSGRPLLATPDVLAELEARGEVEPLGAPSIDWLGVPLKVRDTIIGVLAVQSYSGNVRYSEADKEMLTYVSAQVAQAIERKRAEETLEDRTRELEALNVELGRLSTEDSLTGLANRRLFNDRLDQEWRRAKRTGTPLALISVDVDYFKEFNDAHGHLQGDACLQRLGANLSAAFGRASDLPARMGGDEFCVILADTSLAGATLAAEKLRAAFEAFAIPHGLSKSSAVVTLSVGAAAGVPAPELSADALLRVVDQALYLAKEQGRNRVCALALEQSVSPAPPGAAAPGGQRGQT
jgi:diguanylate cyclase (GGDEF)-like protein/PAS domain S-box-containing protein